MLEFSQPLAYANDYPSPRVPLTPFLHGASLCWRRSTRSSIAVRGQARRELTVSGRVALAKLVKQIGIRPGQRVLLPAYHCPSMVEPFVWGGAEIRFFRVDQCLNPDRRDFLLKLSTSPAAVVFVRYFGFESNYAECADYARRAGAAVIHDCAHAYYALESLPPDDFAVASLVKFFPLEEGGILQTPVSTSSSFERGNPSGLRQELRLISRAAHRAAQARAWFPLGWLDFFTRISLVRREATKRSPITSTGEACSAFRYFRPDECNRAPGRLTTWLYPRLLCRNAASRRRANYQAILSQIKSLRTIRPLFGHLPADVVPYVMPAVIAGGAASFNALRSRGLPLFRWEELASSGCSVSERYRESLIQIPCHQDLSQEDVAYICEVIAEVCH